LFDVPIVNKISSQYSTINSSERLPDVVLENIGTGTNKGLELTLERSFSKNYYFLITGSLFDSWFKAGDKNVYNTYYNTRYVSNILIGKDFPVGTGRKNSIGINAKYVVRGGYRYTPVDYEKSIKSKKVIYNVSATYSEQLPPFLRLDGGINFRNNQKNYSWVIMLDIQNVTNRKNIFKKRFIYENGNIISENNVSLGIVPVFNFRLEF
jgi:outer membrane receptor protein involved in Fe transport